MSEKSFLDNFFDAADRVVGGVEKAVAIKEGKSGLWTVSDILDENGTTYQISDGKQKIECWDSQLANRIADLLNG